jgi:hypothetical protein
LALRESGNVVDRTRAPVTWVKRLVGSWLPTINDLRTCLAKDPLPLEVVKELLGQAA